MLRKKFMSPSQNFGTDSDSLAKELSVRGHNVRVVKYRFDWIYFETERTEGEKTHTQAKESWFSVHRSAKICVLPTDK